MRLDKYICESTTLTRSQAKKVISQGRVKSGDKVVRSSAYKAGADEVISFDDKIISVRGLRYIMINKPQDFICSNVDEQLPSLFNLIDADKKEQLFINIVYRFSWCFCRLAKLYLTIFDFKWICPVTSPTSYMFGHNY